MELKGSETEKNLLKAFAGESQARNRYTYFASVARKEGYRQIEGFFLETAENEKEHAKVFFKHLKESGGDMVEIVASYPAGKIGATKENLLAAANGEHEEWDVLYPGFAKVAREEGFDAIAESFENVAKAEVAHEKRYRKLLRNIEDGEVFGKKENVKWKCRNCGYVHEGEKAVSVCPSCNHKREHFEMFVENY